MQQMDKIPGYKITERDPKEHVEAYKKRFLVLLKARLFFSLLNGAVLQYDFPANGLIRLILQMQAKP